MTLSEQIRQRTAAPATTPYVILTPDTITDRYQTGRYIQTGKYRQSQTDRYEYIQTGRYRKL